MTDKMHLELKEQSDRLGLDMGSYVVHLLMREKDRDKNTNIMNEILKTTQGMFKSPEILDKLIKIEKDKKNE